MQRFWCLMVGGTLSVFALASPVGAPDVPISLVERYRVDANRLIAAALASDDAYARLAELCDDFGHRITGSDAHAAAARWAVTRLRAAGLQARLQPASVKVWRRGRESIAMVRPRRQELAMLGLGGSIATPRRGITADVVTVTSFDELEALPRSAVEGRIVLFNVPFTDYSATVQYRAKGPSAAAKCGAVAALVRSVGPVSLRTPHTGGLRYEEGTAKIPAAAISIEDAEMIARLVRRGVSVSVHVQMQARFAAPAISYNVVADLPGSEQPEEIVVIGGHLDSWDVGQGAHDDAGGCIAAMEAVRLVHALGLRPRRTLRVVLWTNEELGLGGGRAYRDSLGAGVAQHVAAIESDGGMERPVGFDVRVKHEESDAVGARRHQNSVTRARQLAPLFEAIEATKMGEEGGGADIGPLMDAGVPGIAHRTVMERYFDIHHTAADTIDKIDPTEMRKNVAALAVLAYVLADMPGRLDDELP